MCRDGRMAQVFGFSAEEEEEENFGSIKVGVFFLEESLYNAMHSVNYFM